jgi:hypothetical protein
MAGDAIGPGGRIATRPLGDDAGGAAARGPEEEAGNQVGLGGDACGAAGPKRAVRPGRPGSRHIRADAA